MCDEKKKKAQKSTSLTPQCAVPSAARQT